MGFEQVDIRLIFVVSASLCVDAECEYNIDQSKQGAAQAKVSIDFPRFGGLVGITCAAA